MYYKIPLFLLFISLLPLLLLLISTKKLSLILTIVSVLITIILLAYILKKRTIVTFYSISLDENENTLHALEEIDRRLLNTKLMELESIKKTNLKHKILNARENTIQIFLLEYVIKEAVGKNVYSKENADAYIGNMLEMMSEQKHPIIPAILTINWGVEDSRNALEDIGNTRFSAFGKEFTLFLGIFKLDNKSQKALNRKVYTISDDTKL
ncbi:hypothetical protein PAEPH01_0839 [Pancytospora epiphaga]|nr:hypothetical protein PAEPH01_0839 [Pancytospora epiphaga]